LLFHQPCRLVQIGVSDGNLGASGRQAGGGDGDDLGQPASDPGRRTAQQCLNLSHLVIFLVRPLKPGRTGKMALRG
jgi:hypothetical protein